MRELLGTFINALLSAQADSVCGAEYGARSQERTNRRNGYRHRDLDTRAGTIDVAIPKVREGTFFPDWLLTRQRRAEAALTTVVATCYLLGVSPPAGWRPQDTPAGADPGDHRPVQVAGVGDGQGPRRVRRHLRTVSAVETPSSSATRPLASQSLSWSGRISAYIRTARAFSSGGYRLLVFPDMTPTFPRIGVSGHAGAVQDQGHRQLQSVLSEPDVLAATERLDVLGHQVGDSRLIGGRPPRALWRRRVL